MLVQYNPLGIHALCEAELSGLKMPKRRARTGETATGGTPVRDGGVMESGMRQSASARLWLVMMAALAMMLIVVLSAAGCSSAADTTTTPVSVTVTSVETTTTEAPTTTTTAAETTTTKAASTTTTEALSSAEILQPDGTIKAMGYIDKVWEKGGKRYLSIDYAQMLTGEEARQAAIAAGDIGPDEQLDNDYYIVNDNPKKREFTVSDSATFATSTLAGGMGQPATWEEFRSFWSATPPEGAEHLKQMPWWIVRQGNEVLHVEEQYLP